MDLRLIPRRFPFRAPRRPTGHVVGLYGFQCFGVLAFRGRQAGKMHTVGAHKNFDFVELNIAGLDLVKVEVGALAIHYTLITEIVFDDLAANPNPLVVWWSCEGRVLPARGVLRQLCRKRLALVSPPVLVLIPTDTACDVAEVQHAVPIAVGKPVEDVHGTEFLAVLFSTPEAAQM